jgi:Tol biopolymer transport system component
MGPRLALATLLLTLVFVPSPAGAAATTGAAGRLVVVTPTYQLRVLRPDGSGSRTLIRSLPGIHGPIWSPDGTHVAFLRGKPGYESPHEPVDVIRSHGGGLHVVGRGSSVRWSPDSRSLVLVDVHGLNRSAKTRPPAAGRIVVVDVRTGRRRVVARGDAPVWSPDGKRIAFVHYKYSRGSQHWTEDSSSLLTVRPDGSGLRVVRSAVGGQVLYGPTWSPNDRTIAVVAVDVRAVDSEYELWLVNVKTGKATTLASPASGPIEWSPDGRRLAFRSSSGFATVDVNSGRVQTVAVESGDWMLSEVRWSPEGNRIAFEKWNETLELAGVYVVDPAKLHPKKAAAVNWDVADAFDWR